MRVHTVIWRDDDLLPCWLETLACALADKVESDMPQAADHYLFHRDEQAWYFAPAQLLAVGLHDECGPEAESFTACHPWVIVNRASHECIMGVRISDNQMMRLEFHTLAHARQFVERITGLVVDFDEPTDEESDAYLYCTAFARRWRFY